MKFLLILGLVAALMVASGAIEFMARHFAGIALVAWLVVALVAFCLYAAGVRIERR
jgi:hypothetical protein